MNKVLKSILLVAAVIVALSYTFGYGYLWKGIYKTYLHGETGATIDDGKLFSKNTIHKGIPKPWEKAIEYNQKPLSKILSENLKSTNTVAFVVVKDGKLLHEQYWDGYNENSRTNSFSMAKGVTALLLGAAIDDGIIKSENQFFSDFYSSYANVEYGNKLTLKDLVIMEAGLNWDEDYKNPFKPNAKAYYGNSLGKAVLLKGFKTTPGSKFEYQSGATQLLGFALRKSVNIPLSDYASKKIWKPLGMESDAYWSTDDFGMEKTFCCIHSTARDFAKLGQMMINNGKVDSAQVFNPDYLQKMITPTPHSGGAYGYGIWINNESKYKHYFFLGMNGQYIIAVPEKNIVIVRTGSYKNVSKDKKGRPYQVEKLVNETIQMFGL